MSKEFLQVQQMPGVIQCPLLCSWLIDPTLDNTVSEREISWDTWTLYHGFPKFIKEHYIKGESKITVKNQDIINSSARNKIYWAETWSTSEVRRFDISLCASLWVECTLEVKNGNKRALNIFSKRAEVKLGFPLKRLFAYGKMFSLVIPPMQICYITSQDDSHPKCEGYIASLCTTMDSLWSVNLKSIFSFISIWNKFQVQVLVQ